MTMMDDYPGYMFQHTFGVDDYVELEWAPGAVFRVVENTRDYDGTALSTLRFAGPRRGIPPRTVGRLHRHFRIKKRNAEPWKLRAANPMLVLAIEAGG
jgi:hypothetical protein